MDKTSIDAVGHSHVHLGDVLSMLWSSAQFWAITGTVIAISLYNFQRCADKKDRARAENRESAQRVLSALNSFWIPVMETISEGEPKEPLDLKEQMIRLAARKQVQAGIVTIDSENVSMPTGNLKSRIESHRKSLFELLKILNSTVVLIEKDGQIIFDHSISDETSKMFESKIDRLSKEWSELSAALRVQVKTNSANTH